MKILVIFVGQPATGWQKSGMNEYLSRLPQTWQISWQQIPISQASDPLIRMEKEAEAILKKIPPKSFTIVLERKGLMLTNEAFTQTLTQAHSCGKIVTIIIGGPDGVAMKLQSQAHTLLSLSSMILPHQLVKVVLSEIFYRSWAILSRHPYHKVD